MEENSSEDKLMRTTIEAFGAGVGTWIGLFLGPPGVVAGSIAGVYLARGLNEMASRVLSKREQARVGLVISFMASELQARIQNGEQVRQDGFFDNVEGRSSAEELLEGVFIKCKNEYEEKKIRYISKVYTTVAFDSTITPATANQILNNAQQLSYRQLTILACIGQNNEYQLSIGENKLKNFDTSLQSVLLDFIGLISLMLLNRQFPDPIYEIEAVVGSTMTLSPIGAQHFKLLNLHLMPPEEFHFLHDVNE